MRRFRGGYTIIEVMIVLAVTGVLFTSAVIVFHGQQGKTALSQSMYDLASKLQTYATEVNSGVYSGTQNYSCSVSNGKAILSTSAGNVQGSNNDCLFLGRVIQLIPGSSTIYVYAVIGNRDVYSGPSDTGQVATTLEGANPQIASTGSSMVLVDTYNLPSDISFHSASATSAADGTQLSSNYGDLIGLYTDLSNAGGAGTNLETLAFPFPQNPGQNTPYSLSMASCVALNSPCASSTNGYGGSGYQRVSAFKVCVQTGPSQAEVKVKTSSAGISTEVDSQSCS